MARNKGVEIAADRRRQLIASLLARNPRITRRQIHEMLSRPPSEGGVRNPATNKPYSLGTIQADVEAIRTEWQTQQAKSADQWIARTLATYEELELQAWRDGDLTQVRLVMADRRKLLGLDAPIKLAPTDPTGTRQFDGGSISIFEHTDKD